MKNILILIITKLLLVMKIQRIITIDTHDDINVINFTDSLNYTMNTETQVNLP